MPESPDVLAGVVKFFLDDKGYGFITGDDGHDVFVHYSQINPDAGPGHRSLVQGQRVTYHVGDGRKGPEARDVTVAAGGN